MSYVVNWRGSDGQAGWHPVADLQEAAAQVEHLRNVDGVEAVKIFDLHEVAFEFRPYYRVELATESATPAPSPAPEPSAQAAWTAPAEVPEAADAAAEPVVEAAPEPAFTAPRHALAEVGADDGAANGQRRGLFGR